MENVNIREQDEQEAFADVRAPEEPDQAVTWTALGESGNQRAVAGGVRFEFSFSVTI